MDVTNIVIGLVISVFLPTMLYMLAKLFIQWKTANPEIGAVYVMVDSYIGKVVRGLQRAGMEDELFNTGEKKLAEATELVMAFIGDNNLPFDLDSEIFARQVRVWIEAKLDELLKEQNDA